jgi:hypothetical protein
MMAVGAVACTPALLARGRRRALAVAAALALLGLGSLAPPPSGVGAVVALLDAPAVVAGQLGLWTGLATVHAYLRRRSADLAGGAVDPTHAD